MKYGKKRRKRKEIRNLGRASFLLPYWIDRGSLLLACCIIIIVTLIATIPKEIASAQLQLSEENSSEKFSDSTISIEELLIAMRQRLRNLQVPSGVNLSQSVLRIMEDGPMYALSKADILKSREENARIVADTLAWAIHCHIDFNLPDELSTVEIKLPSTAKTCKLPRNDNLSNARKDCLAGKGRVRVSRISFQGHADTVPFKQNPQGEFSDNQGLSDGRAQRFAESILACATDDLKELGTEQKIPYETHGFSSEMPKFSPGRDPRNRRVEIHFDVRAQPTDSLHIR